MKLQTAIDRVNVETAAAIIRDLQGVTDFVEIGTSLIKEYGLERSVSILSNQFPDIAFLADIKTCDEAAYEFEKCYEAGAYMATCMGFASDASLQACSQTAANWQRDWMIDLMELPDDRIRSLAHAYPDAVFGIHLSFDNHGLGLQELIVRSTSVIREAEAADGHRRRIAAAGGITPSLLPDLKKCGMDTVIVGSAITKASNIREAAKVFFEACRQ